MIMRIFSILAGFLLVPLSAFAFFSRKTIRRHEDRRKTSLVGTLVAADSKSTTVARVQQHQGGPWEERFYELVAFQQEHGHCRVPKRYQRNKPLANWVSKQRQEHRKFCNGLKASITSERIAALDQIGFCWNAAEAAAVAAQESSSLRSVPVDGTDDGFDAVVVDEWEERFQSLADYMSQNNLSSVFELPKDSIHEAWIKQQRRLYSKQSQDCNVMISPKRIERLRQVDPHWHLKNRRDLVWETRYQELVNYAKQHGDCCVPISYSNKKLAHWVSNQRKLYTAQLKTGQSNSLDPERKRRLDEIAFVWNRWDYEFDRKKIKEGSFVESK